MKTFTVRVPDETVGDLDRLAQKMDRSRAYVAARAIEDYIARELWQLTEIEAGIAEVERGEFAEAQSGELDTRSMTEIADSIFGSGSSRG